MMRTRALSSAFTANRVLAVLSDRCDSETGHVAISNWDLADLLSMSHNTANCALHRLIDEGKITKEAKHGGRSYPTVYRVIATPDGEAAESPILAALVARRGEDPSRPAPLA